MVPFVARALATRALRWHPRLALVYGVASPCTLDEFALWLRLADVYESPDGRESVEAVAVALLALYAVGQPVWEAVARDLHDRAPSGRLAARAPRCVAGALLPG